MQVSRPLAGRYAFAKRIRGTQRTIIWLGRDQSTGRTVVASVVPAARAAGLSPAIGLSHLHAASVLRVIENPDPGEIPEGETVDADARVVVAEYIDGRSLQQRVDASPVAVETAVEWIASAADALHQLHQKGAVHGAISPRALVVVRPEPAVVPVLTHLLVPPSGAYCSPERVTGGGPSEPDDTWALTATLYTALSRRAPFQGASRTELARAIVAASPRPIRPLDPELWEIVRRGLAADKSQRLSTAAGLRDALRDWMDRAGVQSLGDFAPVEAQVGLSEPPPNVGDLSLVAALERPESPEAVAPLLPDPTFSDSPPPDDGDDAPSPTADETNAAETPAQPPVTPRPLAMPPLPTSASASRSPAKKALTLLAVAIASAVLGLGLGKLRQVMSTSADRTPAVRPAESPALRGPEPTAESSTRVATATDPTAASAPASAEPVPPAPSSEAPVPPATTPAPSASASPSPPGDVTACVRRVLPEGTLRGGPDVDVSYLCKQRDLWGIGRKLDLAIAQYGQGPGMVTWAHLGRFDLAAIALLFQRCCPADATLVTATPKGVCTDLPPSIDELRKNPVPANVDRYAAGVDCYVSRGVRYPSDWWDRVGPKDARGHFDQLLGMLRNP